MKDARGSGDSGDYQLLLKSGAEAVATALAYSWGRESTPRLPSETRAVLTTIRARGS